MNLPSKLFSALFGNQRELLIQWRDPGDVEVYYRVAVVSDLLRSEYFEIVQLYPAANLVTVMLTCRLSSESSSALRRSKRRKQVDNTRTHNHSHQDQTPVDIRDQHNSSRPDYQRSNPHTLIFCSPDPAVGRRQGHPERCSQAIMLFL